MALNTPLINGRAYEFASIVIQMLGAPVISATAISYNEEQEKSNNFGAQTRPVSRGHGAIEASASVTIGQNDVEAMRNIAPDGSLLKIGAFDIVVTFLNESQPVTHILKNAEFKNDGIDISEGDMDSQFSFDLVISHIKWR